MASRPAHLSILIALGVVVALLALGGPTTERPVAERPGPRPALSSSPPRLQPPTARAGRHGEHGVESSRAPRDGKRFVGGRRRVAGERPRHAIVRVRRDRSLPYRAAPRGRVKGRFGARTRFGSRRALWVMGRRGPWLAVSTELRPNGRPAYVRGDHPAIEVSATPLSLHADLSRRRLELRHGSRVVRAMKVGVGRAGSRTPPGRYAVTDKLPGRRFRGVYGCCVLALSGRQSDTPPGWPGGDRLAIHGTKVADSIGRATSSGCLRAGNGALRRLMRRVPVGTPVIVRS